MLQNNTAVPASLAEVGVFHPLASFAVSSAECVGDRDVRP